MKMQKFCYICKEKFEDKYIKDKSIAKLGTIFIIQVYTEVLQIIYVI